MTDPVDALVAAALAPSGSAPRMDVQRLLTGVDPDTLAFAGWRALLLLDDALPESSAWRRRTRSLRRRNFAAAGVAGRIAAATSEALRSAAIDHVVTGDLALAWRYPRPADRPVHGFAVLVDGDAPMDRVGSVLAPFAADVRSSSRVHVDARIGGIDVHIHRGWPAELGGRRMPIVVDRRSPSLAGATALLDPAYELLRILTAAGARAAAHTGDPSWMLDVAVLGDETTAPRAMDAAVTTRRIEFVVRSWDASHAAGALPAWSRSRRSPGIVHALNRLAMHPNRAVRAAARDIAAVIPRAGAG